MLLTFNVIIATLWQYYFYNIFIWFMTSQNRPPKFLCDLLTGENIGLLGGFLFLLSKFSSFLGFFGFLFSGDFGVFFVNAVLLLSFTSRLSVVDSLLKISDQGIVFFAFLRTGFERCLPWPVCLWPFLVIKGLWSALVHPFLHGPCVFFIYGPWSDKRGIQWEIFSKPGLKWSSHILFKSAKSRSRRFFTKSSSIFYEISILKRILLFWIYTKVLKLYVKGSFMALASSYIAATIGYIAAVSSYIVPLHNNHMKG